MWPNKGPLRSSAGSHRAWGVHELCGCVPCSREATWSVGGAERLWGYANMVEGLEGRGFQIVVVLRAENDTCVHVPLCDRRRNSLAVVQTGLLWRPQPGGRLLSHDLGTEKRLSESPLFRPVLPAGSQRSTFTNDVNTCLHATRPQGLPKARGGLRKTSFLFV